VNGFRFQDPLWIALLIPLLGIGLLGLSGNCGMKTSRCNIETSPSPVKLKGSRTLAGSGAYTPTCDAGNQRFVLLGDERYARTPYVDGFSAFAQVEDIYR